MAERELWLWYIDNLDAVGYANSEKAAKEATEAYFEDRGGMGELEILIGRVSIVGRLQPSVKWEKR